MQGRVETAVAVAVAVANEQGLRVDGAIPVGTGSNVIVHLRPSPIVARVMSGTVVLHPDPHAWLAREIAVGAFLAERITAVVAPTREIDPGPYVREGLWLSFWEHVTVSQTPLGAAEIGRALRDLHDALAEYRGPLPPRSAVLEEIDWLLERPLRSGRRLRAGRRARPARRGHPRAGRRSTAAARGRLVLEPARHQ